MLQIRALRKSYGDTIALAGLDLDARRGEVLGIAGPNGAGKSTLVGVLAGEIEADSGEVFLDRARLADVRAAAGVALVHQEPRVFPNLTVQENLGVGLQNRGWRRPKLEVDPTILRSLDLEPHLRRPLAECSLAVRQRCEIATALIKRARLVLFDEPNSALTEAESLELFARMRALADSGAIVLFITHRLTELVQHSNSVAVIRDGEVTRALTGNSLTVESVARELVVHRAAAMKSESRRTPNSTQEPTDVLLRVENAADRRGRFEGVSLEVGSGEVVALMGVEGSGAREIASAIAGQRPLASGSIGAAGGRPVRTSFLPASRASSLFQHFSIANNLVARLSHRKIAPRLGLLSSQRISKVARSAVAAFRVRCRSIHQGVSALSGGNQQKVALASALASNPDVLIAEEPTRGVDVSSKADIYALLNEYCAQGHAVVALVTEVLEAYECADRVIVVDRGRLSSPLQVRDFPSVRALASKVSALERHSTTA